MMMANSELITTAELAGILTQPKLRLFDCTTYLEPTPAGSSIPYVVVSGRQTFEAGHIPGANFMDLQGEFSDKTTELRFMMPSVAQLEAAFGRHGISADSRVVLYSIGTAMWATRFWWMLRSLGFDNAAVLDGGIDKWIAEGRDIETGLTGDYPPATFVAKPRPGLFVGKDEVPLAEAETKFAAQGFSRDKRVVAYCGGGISATIDLFMLHRLGYDKLTLYDASMGEWAKDESLPIERG
jgi:thiosulfate/3-mercaptopyruvate sulfurtransferase